MNVSSDQMMFFGYVGIFVFLLASTIVLLTMPEDNKRLHFLELQWGMFLLSIIIYFVIKGVGLSL